MAKSTTATKILVKNVKLGPGTVQSVSITRNPARHAFVCRSKGLTPLRVRFDGTKFTAGNRSGLVSAKSAADAFAKGVRVIWGPQL